MIEDLHKKVDWSAFEWPADHTVTCKCGRKFRSHVKGQRVGTSFVVVTRAPCPGCGDHHRVQAALGDTEVENVKYEDALRR